MRKDFFLFRKENREIFTSSYEYSPRKVPSSPWGSPSSSKSVPCERNEENCSRNFSPWKFFSELFLRFQRRRREFWLFVFSFGRERRLRHRLRAPLLLRFSRFLVSEKWNKKNLLQRKTAFLLRMFYFAVFVGKRNAFACFLFVWRFARLRLNIFVGLFFSAARFVFGFFLLFLFAQIENRLKTRKQAKLIANWFGEQKKARTSSGASPVSAIVFFWDILMSRFKFTLWEILELIYNGFYRQIYRKSTSALMMSMLMQHV